MTQQDLTDEQWKKRLTPEQYAILREKHTEAPFTGALLHNTERGLYSCAACGAVLFKSEHKFDSGSGWPSFYDLAQAGAVRLETDRTLPEVRTEVLCARCGSHLGHLFHDALDQPTGDRYCINSGALDFVKN
jgi:peptide-methionine (R)-S-oxide reductase